MDNCIAEPDASFLALAFTDGDVGGAGPVSEFANLCLHLTQRSCEILQAIRASQSPPQRDVMLLAGVCKFVGTLLAESKWDELVTALSARDASPPEKTRGMVATKERVVEELTRTLAGSAFFYDLCAIAFDDECEELKELRKLAVTHCKRVLSLFVKGAKNNHTNCMVMGRLLAIPHVFNFITLNEDAIRNLVTYLRDEKPDGNKQWKAPGTLIMNIVQALHGSQWTQHHLPLLRCLTDILQKTAADDGGAVITGLVGRGAFKDLFSSSQQTWKMVLSESPRHNDDNVSDGMVPFLELHEIVISHLDEGRSDDDSSKMVDSVLSTIAFSRHFLKKMWRWLVNELRLPREAHRDATKGWSISSLVGEESLLMRLSGSQRTMLAMFCKSYAHLLKVLGDDEFYGSHDRVPFTLSEHRAIAAVMNCIVCNAILGRVPIITSSTESRRKAKESLLLHDIAVVCRALYERDSRESFCHPSLWLGPLTEEGRDKLNVTPSLARHFIVGAKAEGIEFNSARSVTANLLTVSPQCFRFDDRVALYREIVALDKEMGGWNKAPAFGGPIPSRVTIRRNFLIEDALGQVAKLGRATKGRIEVTFVNEAGLAEAGLDHGGLVKEFLEEFAKKCFDPNLALFRSTDDGCLHPSPLAEHQDNGLPLLYLVGMVIGKCLYEGIMLDVKFANFFIAQILGQRTQLEDLRSYDKELYQNVLSIKHYDQGDVRDLGLFFAVEDDIFGKHVVNELLPGGEDIEVTNENRNLYVHLLANWHLHKQLSRSHNAFISGLSQVISPSWLGVFNPKEVNELLSGGQLDIDVDDLRSNTKYTGGYGESSATIKTFWRVMKGLNAEGRRAVVKFVTSCSRPPLLGFSNLNPPFTIQKVSCESSLLSSIGLGKDVDRLPTAATCFNTLKLPNFKRASTMREKLLYAAKSGGGFELS